MIMVCEFIVFCFTPYNRKNKSGKLLRSSYDQMVSGTIAPSEILFRYPFGSGTVKQLSKAMIVAMVGCFA